MEEELSIKFVRDEDQKVPEEKLNADDTKLMKQIETGKLKEEKVEKEDFNIKDVPKYSWYLKKLIDIDPRYGLVWKDYAEISKQRKVAFYLLKQIGASIFKGKNITNILLPVNIMIPISFMQLNLVAYQYLPAFGAKFLEKDPVEKLKHYLAFSIASLHILVEQRKPFNPIQGETYQGFIGDENIKVYAEQTSYEPPFSNIYIDTPWLTITGKHFKDTKTYPNSIRIKSLGEQKVVFKDEQHTEYIIQERPDMEIEGSLFGKRIVRCANMLTIIDKTNSLYAQARFNPEPQGFFERLFSKTKATRADFFKGFITKNKELLKDNSRKAFYSKDMISYFEGQWLEFMIADGEAFWRIEDAEPSPIIDAPDHLESDSTCRKDIIALKSGNQKEAQKHLEEAEELQKMDRKLRAQFQKIKK